MPNKLIILMLVVIPLINCENNNAKKIKDNLDQPQCKGNIILSSQVDSIATLYIKAVQEQIKEEKFAVAIFASYSSPDSSVLVLHNFSSIENLLYQKKLISCSYKDSCIIVLYTHANTSIYENCQLCLTNLNEFMTINKYRNYNDLKGWQCTFYQNGSIVTRIVPTGIVVPQNR